MATILIVAYTIFFSFLILIVLLLVTRYLLIRGPLYPRVKSIKKYEHTEKTLTKHTAVTEVKNDSKSSIPSKPL